jgi:hypothetical protein
VLCPESRYVFRLPICVLPYPIVSPRKSEMGAEPRRAPDVLLISPKCTPPSRPNVRGNQSQNAMVRRQRRWQSAGVQFRVKRADTSPGAVRGSFAFQPWRVPPSRMRKGAIRRQPRRTSLGAIDLSITASTPLANCGGTVMDTLRLRPARSFQQHATSGASPLLLQQSTRERNRMSQLREPSANGG